MVRALLLSHLAFDYLRLGPDRFGAKFVHPWIVWEPGAWSAPAAAEDEDAGRTQLPTLRHTAPPKGDSLCFELSSATPLKLGRAETNDIVVNDATVSRDHLVLSPVAGGQWQAAVSPTARVTQVNGKPVPPGQSVVLTPGTTLTVGGVQLTFQDPRSMTARVKPPQPVR